VSNTHRMFAILFVVLLSPSALGEPTASSRPNFLILLADDMGFSDAGCYGGEIHTPNLDTLAGGGLQFSQGYNTGRCWPSRAAILTGYYAQQVQRDTIPGRLRLGSRPSWAPLLPQRLARLGYRNYHSGKWHLDGPAIPQGFHRSYMIVDQDRFFWPENHQLDDQRLPTPPRDGDFYATTEIATRAVEFLRQHAAEHPDTPFCHYVAFTSPHFPLHALQDDIDRYRERYLVGWDAIRKQRHARLAESGLLSAELSKRMDDVTLSRLSEAELTAQIDPGEVRLAPAWDTLTERQRQFQATKMAIHAAMIDRMDQEIGRIFAQLEAMRAWDNTVIFFASDNGASAEILDRGDRNELGATPGSGESYLCLGPGWSTAANTPFRYHKSWVFEGGVATPFLLHWPEGIATPGTVRRQPAHLIDLAPTLLELAGGSWADFPTAAQGPPTPGVSLVPLLRENPTTWQRPPIYWRHSNTLALRIGNWKAARNRDDGAVWKLFDMQSDRTEMRDVAADHPKRVKQMVAEHAKIEQTFLDDLR